MKTVLITGGNSMLGLNAIYAFTKRGYKVRALVRHSNPHLEQTNAEIIFGNVTSIHDLESAAKGCYAIVHIAATTDQSLTKLSNFTDINVKSTIAVCQAALLTTSKRVVHVSTTNTIGNGTPEKAADETTPPASPFADNLYAKSKIIAEQTALDSQAQVVIVNPAFMLGHYDTKPSSGLFLKIYHNKRLAFVPKGGKNFVAAADVANLLVDALENGRVGERYLATGQNLSFRQFLTSFYREIGRKAYVIELPTFIFLTGGSVGSLLRWCGIKTGISRTNMKILTTREYYTAQKAITELSFTQSDPILAAVDCYRWMLSNGVIKQK